MQSNHAIPQNVTQYQFRLVGDMTLKQFLELAAGLLLAYLFYSSNLIFLFKYPLALASVFFGVALAFIPIEDRPLDLWIINFIKAIYGPTRFIWEKSHVIPSLFLYEKPAVIANNTSTKTIKAPGKAVVIPVKSDLSSQEVTQIDRLNSLYVTPTSLTPVVDNSKPSVTIRKLSTTQNAPPQNPPSISPESLTVAAKPEQTTEESKAISTAEPNLEASRLNSVFSSKEASPQKAVAAANISLPATPTTPNIISGLVLDQKNKLIENAIVQISNPGGITERAVRTNILGQFAISTPLNNGTYYLEVESDVATFPKTSLILEGKVLSPIKVQATS
ncbi:MAG: carboxypeptidase-like regulatory domain-containing protein [bacterium]